MTGLRIDGRAADEIRATKIIRSYLETAPGAVLIETGGTKLICTVSCEDRVPPFLVGSGNGWLTCEYGMLPGSSSRRIVRESATGKANGRTREIQRLIGRSLRAVVDLKSMGEKTIYVDCDVIQADGGTRTAAITGGYVALVEAVSSLIANGILNTDPVRGQLAAVSVGIVEGESLLDLCYSEDSAAATDMNVVMKANGDLVEIQATAERQAFTRKQLNGLLDLAEKGVAILTERQSAALSDLVVSE